MEQTGHVEAGALALAYVRRLFRVIRVTLHIFYGLLLAVFSGAFFNPYRPLVYRLTNHWLNALLSILGIQIEMRGKPPERTMLIVANHVSWLDIPVLRASHGLYFLSKAEVRAWPLLGHLAAAAGTLFIRRGSGESGRKAAEIAGHLLQGRSVLVFPEGTSTDGQGVRRFFPQLFDAAIQAGLPVQPVAIHYPAPCGGADRDLAFIDDDAFHSHLWHLLLRDRIRVQLTWCVPIDGRGRQRDSLARESRDSILGRL